MPLIFLRKSIESDFQNWQREQSPQEAKPIAIGLITGSNSFASPDRTLMHEDIHRQLGEQCGTNGCVHIRRSPGRKALALYTGDARMKPKQMFARAADWLHQNPSIADAERLFGWDKGAEREFDVSAGDLRQQHPQRRQGRPGEGAGLVIGSQGNVLKYRHEGD